MDIGVVGVDLGIKVRFYGGRSPPFRTLRLDRAVVVSHELAWPLLFRTRQLGMEVRSPVLARLLGVFVQQVRENREHQKNRAEKVCATPNFSHPAQAKVFERCEFIGGARAFASSRSCLASKSLLRGSFSRS